MRYIQKMDIILKCLYDISGDNPTFDKILNKIKDRKIEKGELEDCLLHFYKEGFIYCELNKDRNHEYIDSPDAHYLVSCKAKLFLETNVSFEKEFESLIQEKKWEKNLMERGEKNQERLNSLTGWLAIGTFVLALVEIVKLLHESCHH